MPESLKPTHLAATTDRRIHGGILVHLLFKSSRSKKYG
jgi:hypothetical protein